MNRTRKAIVIAATVALAAGAGAAAYDFVKEPPQAFNATDITGVPWAHKFELIDHTGRSRRLADFRGKVVLMFFGYTHCPDACPTALAELAQVVNRLGREGERVQVLFITTDPARDTPQRLATYVTVFQPSFIGLRGSAEETAKVAREFKTYYRVDALKTDEHSAHAAHQPSNYMVDHSTGILVFDQESRPRLYISANGRTVEAMVADIKRLLRS